MKGPAVCKKIFPYGRPGLMVFTALAVAVLLAFTAFTQAVTAGTHWTPGGEVVCDAPRSQEHPQAIPDGFGGTIVTWADERDYPATKYDIYAQRIDADGSVHDGWVENGVAVCTAVENQHSPALVSDGEGGAIIAWAAARAGGIETDIYAERIYADGSRDPAGSEWIANGVTVCEEDGNQEYPQLATDGAHGAVITWQDERNVATTQLDIYAQRIEADGHAAWLADGAVIANRIQNQERPVLAADGAGGAVIAYEDSFNSWGSVYAQKVDSVGWIHWGEPPTWDGIGIRELMGSSADSVRLTSDGACGAIIAWEDGRSGNKDIYAERIYTDGTRDPAGSAWVANGVPVCAAAADQDEPSIYAGEAGGALLAWRDNRNAATTGRDIYGQLVIGDGTMNPTGTGWAVDGVAVCTSANNQGFPQLTADTSGAIVTWEDERTTYCEIYAQRVLLGGTCLWAAGGVAIRDSSFISAGMRPVIAGDGLFGAFIAWYDDRNDLTTGQDIYAQHVTNDAPTVTDITPSSGANTGPLAVEISGTGFYAGCTVELRKAGQPNLGATGINVVSPWKVTCSFDLSSQAEGPRDVFVRNANGQDATLAAGFTVSQPEMPPSLAPEANPAVSSVVPENGPPGTWVTITGSGFGSSRGSGVGAWEASYVSFNGVQATSYGGWSDTEIICMVPEGATAGPVTVVVNGNSSNSTKTFTVSFPTWYLAEGSTDWGFATYITIENPNRSEVPCGVTYMTKSGPKQIPDITLPPESQLVLSPLGDLGATDFSTKVEARNGKTIAVDRRMIWTGTGAPSPEAHSSVGVNLPATTWYLPEGSCDWGFETWLLIQNPNDGEATCKVTYMTEGKGPIIVEHMIPGNSRKSYNMADDIKMEADASIKVEGDIPVIPERAMYRNNRREGHDSIGTTIPAQEYYLAEGTTDWGFTTYVLVQNPNNEDANVTLTYMTKDGPKEMPPFKMDSNSRKTVRVNDFVIKKDVSTKVHSDKPIIAERAMYWGAEKPPCEACHDSIGMSQPHTTFYLPDGETTNGYETWTLVQNPNGEEVEIEVSYFTPSGQGNKVLVDKVPANSRKTYFMADAIPAGRAAIMVRCKTTGKKIMVERSMYWNNRGAGTDTIGGYSD